MGTVHVEQCPICGTYIVYDSDRNLWFIRDDGSTPQGFHCLNYTDSVGAFKTNKGWVCSEACWNSASEHRLNLLGKPVRRAS